MKKDRPLVVVWFFVGGEQVYPFVRGFQNAIIRIPYTY